MLFIISYQGGFTPLLKACKAGHAGVASKLINANADKDRADKASILMFYIYITV